MLLGFHQDAIRTLSTRLHLPPSKARATGRFAAEG